MGIINPTQSNPGDTIEADDINTPVNQLKNEINGNIESVNIKDGAITAADLADDSVTASKISTSALLLGYATTTTSQGSITTETDLTSLTVTVTVPTGGRAVRISAFTWLSTNVSGDTARIFIKEGATYLGFYTHPMPNVYGYGAFFSVYLPAPTAGSHTYKLAAMRQSGTGTLTSNAGAVSASNCAPYILVELV